MSHREHTRRESLVVISRKGNHVRFRTQPDVVFGNLQRALQRSLDLAALGLRASEEELKHLPDLGTFPRVQFGSRLEPSEIPRHYQAWIVGHAITDLVEALEPLLADTTRICRIAVLQAHDSIDEHKVEEALHATDLEKPLGQKLAVIAAEFPGLIPSELKDALSSLNKLRVCLTHAGGRIRPRDCNVPGALELSQVFWEYWVQYESGRAAPLQRGMVTEESGWIVMRRSKTPRRIEVGEETEFELEDLVTIASTVFELSLLLRGNLYSFVREKGLFPKDFKEPELRRRFKAEVGMTHTASRKESVVRYNLRRLAALGQLILVKIKGMFRISRQTRRKATEGDDRPTSSNSGQTR